MSDETMRLPPVGEPQADQAEAESGPDDAAVAGSDGEPLPAAYTGDPVCNSGEQRAAEPDEGSECVCQEGGFWSCYGVAADRAIGGNAECDSSLTIPQGDCTQMWGDCDDGHAYMITCPNDICVCVVDATIVGQLEPGRECPTGLAAVNLACSWQLR